MDTKTKALIASIVVLAIAVSAVSGVTYSWFSDTEEATISVTTGSIELTQDTPTVTYSSANSGTVTIGTSATATPLGGSASYTANDGKVTVSISAAAPGDTIAVKYSGAKLNNTINAYLYTTLAAADASNNDASNLFTLGSSIKAPIFYAASSSAYEIPDVTVSAYIPDTCTTADLGNNTEYTISFDLIAIQANAITASSVDVSSVEGNASATVSLVSEAKTEGYDDAATTVAFSSMPADAATLTSSYTVKDSTAKIILNLTDSDSKDLFTGTSASSNSTATVTIILKGEFTNVMYYDSEANDYDQPTDVSCTYDSSTGYTTLTFTTTHFSEFDAYNGSYPVSSSDDLVAAMSAGVSAKLTSDVALDSSLAYAVNLLGDASIDFNGKTISGELLAGNNSSNDPVMNIVLSDNSEDGSGGVSSVYSTGTDPASGNVAYAYYGAVCVWTPTVTIESGTYTYDKIYPVYVNVQQKGMTDYALIIEDGTFKTGSDSKYTLYDASGLVHIEDGTFTSNAIVLYAIKSSTGHDTGITVDGGTFTGSYCVEIDRGSSYRDTDSPYANVTINGGTFTQTGDSGAIFWFGDGTGSTATFTHQGVITVNGGTFKGTTLVGKDDDHVTIDTSNLVINAGTFYVDPTSYVASTSTMTTSTDSDGATIYVVTITSQTANSD